MDTATQEILTQVNEKLGGYDAKFQSIDAKLAEIPDAFTKAFEAKREADKPKSAEMHQGLEGLSRMEVWDVPIGQALIGGFSAVLASELIDGFLAARVGTTALGVIKLAGAGVLVKWGGRLLGKTGATAAAIILAYDGIRQILPVDEWAGRLAGGVTTRVGGGLAGKAGMRGGRESAVRQAERVAADYYAKAEGRI